MRKSIMSVCGAAALAGAFAQTAKAGAWEEYLDPPEAYAEFPREVRFVTRYACREFDVELYEQANGPKTRQRVMMAVPRGLKGRAPCVVVPFYFPEAMLGFDPKTGSIECPLAPAGTNLTYFSTKFMSDLTRRGYITVSADAYHRTYCAPKGDWADWKRAGEALNRDWPGWTGVGKLTFDTRLLVDLAAADARVDAGRIGMIGHSLGGKMAYCAGLTDPRVRAIVASDFGLGWTQTNWNDVWYWGAKLEAARSRGLSNADLYVRAGFKPLCLIAGEYDDADSELILRGATPPEKRGAFRVIRHGTGHRPPEWAKEESYRFLDSHLKQGAES